MKEQNCLDQLDCVSEKVSRQIQEMLQIWIVRLPKGGLYHADQNSLSFHI